jgi:hypothetical protein
MIVKSTGLQRMYAINSDKLAMSSIIWPVVGLSRKETSEQKFDRTSAFVGA